MIALSPPLRRPLVVTPHGYYQAPRPLRKGTHYGLDFAAPKGDPVVAAAPGSVARTGFDDLVAAGGGGGGNYVILSHTDAAGARFETGYMHLDTIGVAVGDELAAGDELGTVGNTGTASSGPHLHFQVKQLVGAKRLPVDPTPILFPKKSAPAPGGGVLVAGLLPLAVGAWWVLLR